MSIRSKLSGYAGQLLTGKHTDRCVANSLTYVHEATALTSLSFHLLFARRDAAAKHAQFTARITILESLVGRLRTGERVADAEIDKLTSLSRKIQQGNEDDDLGRSLQPRGPSVSWKEVLLGKLS